MVANRQPREVGEFGGPLEMPRATPRPPRDPLRATEWLHAVIIEEIYDAISDKRITGSVRRREIAMLAGRAAALIPLSRLSQAEAIVLGRHEGAAEGPRTEEVEHAAPLSAVDPAGGGPPARRGRPRKRSVR